MADFLPRVPVDISSLIFFYACQPTPDPFLSLGSNPRWERQFHPLWLGQVCRSWRDLAWETSELWQTVVIKVRESPTHIEAQTDLLREWLCRAKGRPLDIYLEENENEWFSDAIDPMDLLLTLLVRHSQQWRTVDFHLLRKRYLFISCLGIRHVSRMPHPRQVGGSSNTRNDSQMSEERSIPLNLLQTASLHGVGNNEALRSDLPLNLARASSLRELTFSSILMRSDMLVCLPTKRITSLKLSLVLRIVPRELLAQLPQLTELTLSKCSVVRKLEPNAGSRPIIHENLRVLHIEVESEFLLNMIVHQLSFPALKTLYVCVPESFRHTNFLLAFIKRSACALSSLTTESMCSTADYDLIEFLSSDILSSSLKELHILDYDTVSLTKNRKKIIRRNKVQGACSGLDHTFFENFHPYLFPHFLPHLETLEYRGILSAYAIDFLEPFILRSRMRDSEPGCMMDDIAAQGTAILRKVRIQADKALGKSFSIAEYPDPQYVWEVISMIEVGVLTLLDADGALWA
ncbi:hypothetical protein CVT25_009081 [Psilocybe cyanescens]|uniref:F-box domain-containing protein n=1 Tax=Psilocybe cyanescens TaxID=93625 RepID=A0A409VNI0_PSICY|nr:hypothetical protein CVT25_009081 [Psilocybe cyanescens]